MIAGGWMGGVGTEAKSPRWAIGNNTHSVSKLQVVLLLSCEPTLEQTKILGTVAMKAKSTEGYPSTTPPLEWTLPEPPQASSGQMRLL